VGSYLWGRTRRGVRMIPRKKGSLSGTNKAHLSALRTLCRLSTSDTIEESFCSHRNYEEQHSLLIHQPASNSRAFESIKQRSLQSFSLSSCLSFSLAVVFYLELSPFVSGATGDFPLPFTHQRHALSIRVTARTLAERE